MEKWGKGLEVGWRRAVVYPAEGEGLGGAIPTPSDRWEGWHRCQREDKSRWRRTQRNWAGFEVGVLVAVRLQS